MIPQIVTVNLKNDAVFSDWLKLLDHYAHDPMGGSGGLGNYAKSHLRDALNTLPTFHSALAYDKENAIGLINCFSGFSTFAAKPLMNVHDVVVHADWRKKGIASLLLQWAEDRARQLGCCKLTLEVLSNNQPAMTAYQKAGYAPYTLDPAAGNALLLQKYLLEL